MLRYPQIGRLPFGAEMIGAKVTITGASKAEGLAPMEFEADVNKLALDLKEGGTVEAQFRIQFLPEDGEVGLVAGFLGKKAKVTIVAAPAVSDLPPTSTE